MEAELAEMLLGSWKEIDVEIWEFGTVLEFRSAWIDPVGCPAQRWAHAAEAIIAREFDDHVLLVLKTFPLEYEGADGVDAQGLKRRQKAMARHYSSLLSVDPIPGDTEWMWRSNSPGFAPEGNE